MTVLEIRELTETDFAQVWDIFTTAFPMKYGMEFQDAWRLRDTKHSYGAFVSTTSSKNHFLSSSVEQTTIADSFDGGCDTKQSDCLAGFMLVRWKEADDWHIEFLGVNHTCQKGGIGTTLLHVLLKFCQETQSRATLIPVDDPRIIHWYKKQGFVECGAPRKSSYTGDLEQLMEFKSQKEILI
jgi:ribosomal protein S18 acetylase RimI-like enzyme